MTHFSRDNSITGIIQTNIAISSNSLSSHINSSSLNFNKNKSINNDQIQTNKKSSNTNQIANTYKFDDTETNQDICFKCKKYGEIYCCDNCFRSFHWKCISSKKLEELTKMTHVINFICESCENQKKCIQCKNTGPIKSQPLLISYSDENSILTYFKCSHCYSMIHKKCLEIPMEALQRKYKQANRAYQSSKLNNFDYYLCKICLQNVGITEIINSQRIVNNIGIQKLYFFVLLKTKSPVHKGWFQQIVLKNHLKSLSGDQKYIDQFLKFPNLYNNPQIQKIIMVKPSMKHKRTMISDIVNIIEERKKIPNNERYGNAQNFKFLVKWKNRSYTSLTWEDQVVVAKYPSQLKQFLIEKEKDLLIKDRISKSDTPFQKNENLEQHLKILQHFISKDSKISQKYLQKSKKVETVNTSNNKLFQDKMIDLDEQNSAEQLIQLIKVNSTKCQTKQTYQYIIDILKYFRKCHKKSIILRPILIITNEIYQWVEHLKLESEYGKTNLKYLYFQGTKQNNQQMKNHDYFTLKNPPLFKFDILLIKPQYFIYQKQFIFNSIPVFFTVLFDNFNKFDNGWRFIEKNYFPYKSKVQKQIFLFDKQSNITHFDLAQKIYSVSGESKTPLVIYHSICFKEYQRISFKQPKIKIDINKKYKSSVSIFQTPSKQILNQAQRLSFLKFVMAFGLNVSAIDQMLQLMRKTDPLIWQQDHNDQQETNTVLKKSVKEYLGSFMSIISKHFKQTPSKSLQPSINYYLFGFKSESIFKRIIQLKILKSKIKKCSEDHEKFLQNKAFSFFFSGQLKRFPLWNTYEDYTLGALIFQQGYERWNQIIESKKWKEYHSQLQTRKIYKYDKKNATFNVQEQIVPIKKKNLDSLQGNSQYEKQMQENSQISSWHGGQDRTKGIQDRTKGSQDRMKGSQDRMKGGQDRMKGNQKIEQEYNGTEQTQKCNQTQPETYGEYLMRKIKSSKQFKEIQYEKLLDLQVLKQHIAQRGQWIIMSMSLK